MELLVLNVNYPTSFRFSNPVRSDTRRALLFGVTSGNRAKRGYTPPEFRETRRLESEP